MGEPKVTHSPTLHSSPLLPAPLPYNQLQPPRLCSPGRAGTHIPSPAACSKPPHGSFLGPQVLEGEPYYHFRHRGTRQKSLSRHWGWNLRLSREPKVEGGCWGHRGSTDTSQFVHCCGMQPYQHHPELRGDHVWPCPSGTDNAASPPGSLV